MKKLLTIILTLVASLSFVFLTACGEEIKTNTIYDTLNNFLYTDYNDLIITINTENGGFEVQSKYTLVFGETTKFTYHVEELNEFSQAGGEYSIPDSYKKVYEGTAEYTNGKVVKIDGENVEISPETIDHTRFTFNQEYFTDVEQTAFTLKANITDVDKFLGTTNSGYKDAKVEVTYGLDAITQIQVTFKTTDNSNIKVLYMFNNTK